MIISSPLSVSDISILEAVRLSILISSVLCLVMVSLSMVGLVGI